MERYFQYLQKKIMSKKRVQKILDNKTYELMSRAYHSTKNLFTSNTPTQPDPQMLYPHKVEMIEGKLICLELIPNGSTIISGGVGNDVKFELELIKRKNTKVVGLDPTSTAENFVAAEKEKTPELRSNYIYLKKALSDSTDDLKLYFGEDDFMSSVSSQHRDTKTDNFFVCQATTIDELMKEYKNVSYLKIDIEGAEYNILNKLEKITIPQISIEFHHHCSTEYKLSETISLIEKVANMGYDVLDYGAYHGRDRKLPAHVSKWSDLNCELLFIRK